MRRLIGAVITASALIGGMLVTVTPAQAVVTCEKFGTVSIQGGRYIVQNNVWGADTAQCVDTTANGFNVTRADHNKATNGAPAAYPSVYFGCHFGNCSSGSGLPLQTNTTAFNNIRTSVSMTYPGSGIFDAAYDIWFDPTPRTDGQNTGAEIMVWLNHTGSIQPFGSQIGTATIAGSTYNVWFGNMGWNVVSYVRTSTATSLNFAVNDFYSDTINRGLGQRNWFLTSIQAGFEPWVGGAGLAVNSFSVTTDGAPPPPPPPPPPGGCTVRDDQNAWNTGYTSNFTITNRSATAINGWSLVFTLPAGQVITSTWNATYTPTSGQVTARNVSFNAAIPANGGTVSGFGFQATHTGNSAKPTAFTLNGTACTVG